MANKSPKQDKSFAISVDRLVPGLYVDVGLNWTEHPFLFRKFRIKSQDEIDVIKSLVKEVTVFPGKSVVGAEPERAEEARLRPSAEESARKQWNEKKERMDEARHYREQRRKLSQRYQETSKKVMRFNKDVKTSPANAIKDAQEIVEALAGTFESSSSVLIDLINLSDSAYGEYAHSLNVTVLAMSIAKALELPSTEMRDIAMGALLHDIGKTMVPAKVLMKKGPLTGPEQKLAANHPLFGVKLVDNLPAAEVSEVAKKIIAQHHELADGTGYPRGIKGKEMLRQSQIVALANIYDNFCNPPDPAQALNPKTAMATLYTRFSDKLDPELIGVFVRSMGIYPPGTLVKLSDESVGLVINVDSSNLLKPSVLLYNPDIPRSEALLVNLCDISGLTIDSVLNPEDCPENVKSYLGLKERLGYFVSEGAQ